MFPTAQTVPRLCAPSAVAFDIQWLHARLSNVPRALRISSLKFMVVTRTLAAVLLVGAAFLASRELLQETAHVDRALYAIGGGIVAAAALWFLSAGYSTLVLDDGDALLVGRTRTRVPLGRVTSVTHNVPTMRGGRAYTEIVSPAFPGGSFSYIPRDLATGLTSVPEPPSTTELRLRVERARGERARGEHPPPP